MTIAPVASPVYVAGVPLPLHEVNVVLLGANGSGKSTAGVTMLSSSPARRISARRALNMADKVPVQQLSEATEQYARHTTASSRQRAHMTSDFSQVYARLLAEETEQARQIRDQIASGKKLSFLSSEARSNIDIVRGIWEPLFPGRRLEFSDHTPIVQGGEHRYHQVQLSDGELQALYLVAKVTIEYSETRLLVVDEPEIHFHGALARRLWDAIEAEFPDMRFLYITHDIPFATSRRNARLAILEPGNRLYLVEDGGAVPSEIAEQILGAASASVNPAVYCEGKRSSPDAALFEAVYRHTPVEIVPAGSCDSVVECVRSHEAVVRTGRRPFGIVDRDERCEEEIAWLGTLGIHALPVAEIEHLYALPAVASIVATGILHRSGDSWSAAMDSAVEQFSREKYTLLHHHAQRFAVERLRWATLFPSGPVSPGRDMTTAAENLNARWQLMLSEDPRAEVDKARQRLEAALESKDAEVIYSTFSGKSIVEFVARKLEVSSNVYRQFVVNSLLGKHGRDIEVAVRAALTPALPPGIQPRQPP